MKDLGCREMSYRMAFIANMVQTSHDKYGHFYDDGNADDPGRSERIAQLLTEKEKDEMLEMIDNPNKRLNLWAIFHVIKLVDYVMGCAFQRGNRKLSKNNRILLPMSEGMLTISQYTTVAGGFEGATGASFRAAPFIKFSGELHIFLGL